jgi:hypothetical protein
VSGGRWKYKTETVAVEGNCVTVRELTTGERSQFLKLHRAQKDSGGSPLDTQAQVLRWSITDPAGLTDEDVAGMPPALNDLAIEAVLRLSGISKGDDEKKGDPEPS